MILVVVGAGHQPKYTCCTESINVLTNCLKSASCRYTIKSCMLLYFGDKLHCAPVFSFSRTMCIGPYSNWILHRPVYMYFFPMSNFYYTFEVDIVLIKFGLASYIHRTLRLIYLQRSFTEVKLSLLLVDETVR